MLVHVHSWVWAVLPGACRRVAARGDSDLADVLQASGLDVDADGARADEQPPDALLLAPTGGIRAAMAGLDAASAPLVAVALGAWPVHRTGVFASRLLRRLLGPVAVLVARARVRRLRRSMQARGYEVSTLPTGDRCFRHVLGAGHWPGVRRLPVSAVVLGSRGELPPSTTVEAAAHAAHTLERPLRRGPAMVTESGKILQALRAADDGSVYVQQIGGGPSRDLVTHAVNALAQLRAQRPGAAVEERVPWTTCSGQVGVATYSVEPLLAGRPPRHLDARLWEDCLEFVAALWDTGRTQPVPPSARWAQLDASLGAVRDACGPADADQVRRLGDRLHCLLEQVPVGWAHGDLWPRNLLVRGGRLAAVVDWDSAERWALPLGDLLDLLAHAAPGARPVEPGPRTFTQLWPQLDSRTSAHVRDYCMATGVTEDPLVLQGLAVAYWLDRASRDLAPFRWNSRAPGWASRNVTEPLAFLSAHGWTGRASTYQRPPRAL